MKPKSWKLVRPKKKTDYPEPYLSQQIESRKKLKIEKEKQNESNKETSNN